jgi:hypothetical protein
VKHPPNKSCDVTTKGQMLDGFLVVIEIARIITFPVPFIELSFVKITPSVKN